MPLTFSIANGVSLGIIAYCVINALGGRVRRIHWMMWLIAALLVARFIWLNE